MKIFNKTEIENQIEKLKHTYTMYGYDCHGGSAMSGVNKMRVLEKRIDRLYIWLGIINLFTKKI